MTVNEDMILKTEKLFLKHSAQRMSKYFGKKKNISNHDWNSGG